MTDTLLHSWRSHALILLECRAQWIYNESSGLKQLPFCVKYSCFNDEPYIWQIQFSKKMFLSKDLVVGCGLLQMPSDTSHWDWLWNGLNTFSNAYDLDLWLFQGGKRKKTITWHFVSIGGGVFFNMPVLYSHDTSAPHSDLTSTYLLEGGVNCRVHINSHMQILCSMQIIALLSLFTFWYYWKKSTLSPFCK